MRNGRPVFSPMAGDPLLRGVTVYPSLGGGTNFRRRRTGEDRLVLPLSITIRLATFGRPTGYIEAGPAISGSGNGGGFGAPQTGAQPNTQGVMAIDPETGKVQWKFELAAGWRCLRVSADGNGG